MQVADLYTIVRELKKISILQANLAELLKTIDRKSPAYQNQLDAQARLQKLIDEYGRYSI